VYRVTLDTGKSGRKVRGRMLYGEIFLWVIKECSSCAIKEDKLWLDH
jgi:hypothetical protein